MQGSVADSEDLVIFLFFILERMGASLTGNVHQALAVPRFAEWGPQTDSPGISSSITPGWWDVQQGSVPSPYFHSQQAESGLTLLCCHPNWSCFNCKIILKKIPQNMAAWIERQWNVGLYKRVIVSLTWAPQGTGSWPRRCSSLKSAIWCSRTPETDCPH